MRRHAFDGPVGAVAPAVDGSLLVAARQHLVTIRTDGSRVNGPRVVPSGAARRLNDASTDPAGRFVVGTLSLDGPSTTEEVVRLEPDGALTRIDEDLALSNGLAWSTNGQLMYSVDTTRRVVYVRTYDQSGLQGMRRVHLRLDDGLPDGIALDLEDHLWVAMWGSGELRRFAPDATLVERLALPVPYPASVAFAGDDLRTLVITTAGPEAFGGSGSAVPGSGRLFTARADVPGAPVPLWSGSAAF